MLIEPRLDSLITGKGLNLTKVDTSKEMDTALRYDVLSLPTLIFFRRDKEVIRLSSTDVSLGAIEKVCTDITGEK